MYYVFGVESCKKSKRHKEKLRNLCEKCILREIVVMTWRKKIMFLSGIVVIFDDTLTCSTRKMLVRKESL